jgi:hypothetical protein
MGGDDKLCVWERVQGHLINSISLVSLFHWPNIYFDFLREAITAECDFMFTLVGAQSERQAYYETFLKGCKICIIFKHGLKIQTIVKNSFPPFDIIIVDDRRNMVLNY